MSSAESILIVEDDDAVRALLVEILSAAGFSITAVGLAEDALEVLRVRVPALVILDLGMPEGMMQGVEFLATLRETDAWKTIPVVIFSALGDVVNRDVTTRLGVTAVVSKPVVDLEWLLKTIRDALP